MPLTTPQTAALQLGVSAIPSVIQGIQGIRQNTQANRMLKNIKRPTLGIPTAETEALNVARNMASSFNLPNQFQAEQALNQQYTGGINNATNTASSSAEALAASVALSANRMNAQNNLAGQAANSYMLRNQNLQTILGDYADWQQKSWDWNTGNKYLADAATASALKQAGQTNIFNATSNLAGMAAESLPTLLGKDNTSADKDILDMRAVKQAQRQSRRSLNGLDEIESIGISQPIQLGGLAPSSTFVPTPKYDSVGDNMYSTMGNFVNNNYADLYGISVNAATRNR